MIGPRIRTTIGPNIWTGVGVDADEVGGDAPVTTTLSLAIGETPDPVITAVNFTMSVTTNNVGAVDATSVVVTVTLDASLTYVTSSGTGWATGAVGQVVTATRATMAPFGGSTISITCTSGGSALTATTTVSISAANAPTVNDSEDTTVKLVDRDATKGWRFPSSATQWSDFNAYQIAIGRANYPNVSPASFWAFQQASGNSTDSIGGITLTPANWTTFQSAAANFTRVCIRGVDATANSSHSNTTTAPNPSLTSTFIIGVLDIPAAPAALRGVMSLANNVDLRWNTNGKLRLVAGATSDLVNVAASTQQIVGIRTNNTATTITVFTNQEKFVGTYAAPVNAARVSFGGIFSPVGGVGYLAGYEFTGASAEMSDAGAKALWEALTESTVPWS